METNRRREIEDAASSLFRERGYSGTSVRDIARAVDIQGASQYAHVASKQDVLWAIVERAGQSKGWWLGQLGIAHSQSHRGQATVIRLLQGIRR